jgi:DNA-binding beta-propeller fold protein YncE
MRIGQAPQIPAAATKIGPVSAAAPLSFDVALEPSDPAGLQRLATAISTSGSGQFRRYLTTTQFAHQFGAAPSVVSSVDAALREEGLTPGTVSTNHLLINVSTTVGLAQQALHTSFDQYRLASGRIATVNATAPELPSSIIGDVQSVVGLNTLLTADTSLPTADTSAAKRASTSDKSTSSGPSPCLSAVDEGEAYGAWTANQLAKAYSINSLYANGQLGAHVRVALFELGPFAASDIATYQSCYGTSATVKTINVDGGPGASPISDETTADIETTIGLAPKATVLTYEAPPTNFAKSTLDEFTTIITQHRAQILSSSIDECEAALNNVLPGFVESEDTLFQEAATAGISVFVASGDVGSTGCYQHPLAPVAWLGTVTQLAAAVAQTHHTEYIVSGDGSIKVVDDWNFKTVATIETGWGSQHGSISVDPTTHEVFVTLDAKPKLIEFSSATCNAVKTTNCTIKSLRLSTLTPDLEGVAADPATGTVYVALSQENKVAVVKEAGLSRVGTVSNVGPIPYAVAVDPATNSIYVTDLTSVTSDGSVDLIKGATCDAAISTGCGQTPSAVSVGLQPVSVVLDAAVGQLIVANQGGDSISILSASTGQTLATFGFSSFGVSDPGFITLSPDGGHLLIPYPAGLIVFSLEATTQDDQITGVLNGGMNTASTAASDPSDGVVTATEGDGYARFFSLSLGVMDPASQPWVTSVGGTDLTAIGPSPTETTWNEGIMVPPTGGCIYLCQDGAGTGGISMNWSKPSWQKGPGVKSALSSGTPCHAATGLCREVPDVSASAATLNGYIYYESGWTFSGGTSLSAPLWAALLAVIESSSATPVGLGFLNPELYAAARSGSGAFNDITVGNNDYVGTNFGSYPATPGYDMATGLGSPVAPALQAILTG